MIVVSAIWSLDEAVFQFDLKRINLTVKSIEIVNWTAVIFYCIGHKAQS